MGIRLAVVLAWLVWPPLAHAASFVVTNTNDTGTGSLRTAITNANGAQGNNTIVITATGTIDLLSPLPPIAFTLTLTGPGASQLTIRSSTGTFPVLLTTNGTVQISGVTIKDGGNAGGNGGGIVVTGGSLVLLDSTIAASSAALGSAIFSTGALTIQRCTISGNTGSGVIYGGGDTTISDSTIADNQGTAIVFPTATKALTIDRSTISGNTDTTGVGGLQLQGGTATIRNTTFSGNTGAQGGDFWTFSDSVTLSLTNVTAAGGSAPALLFDHTATVTLRNTIFSGTGARCSSTNHPTSQGHNLASDTTCNLTGTADRSGIDPMLGPLAANGGATKTHAPLAGSPALNTGDSAALQTLDQRGKPRVQFAVADLGAVEVTEPLISQQPMAQAITEGSGFTLKVVAMNQNSTTPLTYQWRKDGSPMAGATSDTYVKQGALVADSGMYDVLVTNDGGSLSSMAVAVTVTPAVMGDGPPSDSGGGGCCSSTGEAAWSTAGLGLVLVGLLGLPRRGPRRRAGE